MLDAIPIMAGETSASSRLSHVLSLVCLAAGLSCARRPPDRLLVVAYPAGLHSTDVNDPAHEEFAMTILANVYETLIDVAPDLSLKPGLAESWYSPDDLTWVFRLRRGVLLHDGRTLTAGDVVASFERARANAFLRGELAAVTEVKARGDLEVVFSTRVPFQALPQHLTYLFVTGTPTPDAPASGTGPYRIRSWQPNGATVLEAFAGYRGGPPPIAGVRYETVPSARERARLLRKGEVHLVSDVLPEEMDGEAPAGVSLVARPGLRAIFLAMDCAHTLSPFVKPEGNPFRDRRVREAVALAVDRDALVAGPLHGFAERIDQLPAPGEIGFDASLQPAGVDLQRARKLLADVAPRGFDVQLDYMTGKYLAAEAVVEALAAQLGQIGIRVRSRAYSPAELFQHIERHDTSLYLLGWRNDSRSVQETYASLLHSPRDDLGGTNGGAFSSPELDALLDAAPAQLEVETRTETLKRATQIVDAEHPIVPLYRQKTLYAFASDLAFEPKGYAPIRIALLRWKN